MCAKRKVAVRGVSASPCQRWAVGAQIVFPAGTEKIPSRWCRMVFGLFEALNLRQLRQSQAALTRKPHLVPMVEPQSLLEKVVKGSLHTGCVSSVEALASETAAGCPSLEIVLGLPVDCKYSEAENGCSFGLRLRLCFGRKYERATPGAGSAHCRATVEPELCAYLGKSDCSIQTLRTYSRTALVWTVRYFCSVLECQVIASVRSTG